MSFRCIEPEKLYAFDPNLKKQDVEILQLWLEKQPHLPKLEEAQILIALHGCYYQIEKTKTIIDNYYTIRSLCPEIFQALTPDVLKLTVPVAMATVLPETISDNYGIIMLKLLDTNPSNYNCANLINVINMVATLYLHQNGPKNGVIALFDMKGFSLGHIPKLNLNAIKYALTAIQEAVAIRLKGVHVMNAIPLVDKIMALVKPFVKNELLSLLHFHPPNSDTLYQTIPKKCLPEEYGGLLPSSEVLNEQTLNNLLENYNFFKWHDGQKVDESKRMGKSKIINDVFGVDGTFKKLEID